MSKWTDIVRDYMQKVEEACKSGGSYSCTIEEVLKVDFARYMIQCEGVEEAFSAGDERRAADLIYRFGNSAPYSSQRALLEYVNRFKDPTRLFECIMDVYTNDGYGFPRSLIQRAKKISKDIPEEKRLAGLLPGNVITVYRGTMSEPHLVKYEPSWTTSLNVAIWFAYRDNDSPNIYQGEIERNKIIAFLNDRNECEVLQHGNVRNITALDISEQQIDAAMDAQRE